MRTSRFWIAALLTLAPACSRTEEPKLETDTQKAVYGLGSQIGANMKTQMGTLDLSKEESDLLLAGIADQFAGTPKVNLEDPEHRERLNAFQTERIKAMAEKEAVESKAFLEKLAKEEGAQQTDSGLVYKEIEAGKGATPGASDTVKVSYRGTLRDGTEFDKSADHGEPPEFPLNSVIPCWTEGLQKMKEGGKARLVCPSSIAYGERGQLPTIKPGAALLFEVELLRVTKAEAPKP